MREGVLGIWPGKGFLNAVCGASGVGQILTKWLNFLGYRVAAHYIIGRNSMKTRLLTLLLVWISLASLFAEDAPAQQPAASPTAAPEKAAEASFTIGGVNLTIQDAINIVLEKNLTLQSAKYDVVMSDTNARKLDKKFAPVVSAEGQHLGFSDSPLSSTSRGYQYNGYLGISKLFATGTTVGGGYRYQQLHSEATLNGFLGLPINQPATTSTFNGYFINVQQELYSKNSFGYADRKHGKNREQAGRRPARVHSESFIRTCRAGADRLLASDDSEIRT
jgi:hypothetical protein